MKWLFMLLLLVNLAILGWGLQRDPDIANERPVMRPGIGNLHLLSELKTEEGLPVQKPVRNPESSGVDKQAETAATGTEDKPMFVTGSSSEKTMPLASDAPQQREGVAEAPADEVIPPEPPNGDETAALDTSDTPSPAEESPPVLVCGAFGPFERGTEARTLAESLASQGMDTSLRRESMDKPIGYWVMIQPLASQEAAIEKVKQLRASGIEDIRRFVKGDQKNGISLGVFSSKKNAQSRQQEIAAKGHSSSVVPRLITVPSYWVDYRSDQARLERAESSLRERQAALKNTQYPCSRVVTTGGIF
ncbi:SPOR domain-containing protein [Sedimenticola sp.]|uniref:SPOR domain-containing protein n=1 Tax=Sedimenticola sp. TaxID=1940285 RepID=UPI003D113905